MKKILAFAGSTSSTSINKKLATFTAQNLENTTSKVINLRDFKMPIYSFDEEKENGIPEDAKKFSNLFDEYDGFIISLAEHNGSYTAAFKNMFDWASRIDIKVFRNKPILLMSTSPGRRGGLTVLEQATATFPRHGASQVFSFSLPSFFVNFKEDKIINEEFLGELKNKVQEFENLVNQ